MLQASCNHSFLPANLNGRQNILKWLHISPSAKKFKTLPPRKLAIVCTHPIQYSAPVFRAIAELGSVDLRVFYTWSQAATDTVFDVGFGKEVKWDVPLLEGYAYTFVQNTAKRPGPDHFGGLENPTLTGEIEAWRPDAVLVYTWNSKSHLQALRYFKGRLPVLFRGDSTLLDPRSWWRASMRRLFLTWVYSHVDIAIAVGSHNRDYFTWCGIPKKRIALAPHSIDTKRFAADKANHDEVAERWRKELDIPPDAVVILFAGKLQPKKNPFLLLAAFRALRNDSHLVFVGNGELEEDLRREAATVERVHFMPFQNQSVMPAVYRTGDVFVLPSQGPEETWGLAVNEAMASGRVVIASSRVGGAIDLVQHEVNGWVFQSGDVKALEATLQLACNAGRQRLHAMGNLAQTEAVNWSSEESARRIGDAFLASVSVA